MSQGGSLSEAPWTNRRLRNIEARALVALSMAGEQNPASASRSSAFLAVETYPLPAGPGYSLEKKCMYLAGGQR
eukprot:scaffold110427_cov30-Phaeocystis_antarctica.AAC.1